MPDYDAIIIGGGHNGLVASCLLAKQGLKILTLEKNSFVGGCASTGEVFPGYKFSLGAHCFAIFRQQLIDELELVKHGFTTYDLDPQSFYPFPSGKYLTIHHDYEKIIEGIKDQFSRKDVEGVREFFEFWKVFAAGIGQGFYNPPVPIGQLFSMFSGAEAETALKKAFFIGSKEYLDELVESEELKGALAYWGADGFYGSPREPGSNLMAGLHFSSGEPYRFIKGGMGGVSEALARSLNSLKGTLKLESPIKNILIEKGKAIGVEFEDGEKITSRIVLSSLDPQNTFLKRVGVDNLPKDFVKGIKNIQMEPVAAQALIALKELPKFKCLEGKEPELNDKIGLSMFSPSIEYLEKAWDDCKYGKASEKPVFIMTIPSIYDADMAPQGHHSASLYMQWMPYNLKEGNYEEEKEKLADRAIDLLTEYAPNFKGSIINKKVFAARDYENMFGATKGNFWHGELKLSQLFNFRPVPGWSQYKTPIENLYLCGAGTHPGGGVTGAPGHNAAKIVLRDWGKKK